MYNTCDCAAVYLQHARCEPDVPRYVCANAYIHTTLQQTCPPTHINSHAQLRCRSERGKNEFGVLRVGFDSVCVLVEGGFLRPLGHKARGFFSGWREGEEIEWYEKKWTRHVPTSLCMCLMLVCMRAWTWSGKSCCLVEGTCSAIISWWWWWGGGG